MSHTHDQIDNQAEPDSANGLEAVQTDPVADARRLLAEVEEAKRQSCAQEIAEVLGRHGFELQVSQPSVYLVPVRG